MKKLIYLTLAFTAIISSCEYYESDDYDFSNTVPAYVIVQDTSMRVVPEGGSVKFELRVPEVVYQDITVEYQVTGGYSSTGSFTIPSGTNRNPVSVAIPAGIVSEDALNARLTLTGVNNGYQIGRVENQNISFPITIDKFVPFQQSDYTGAFSCLEPGYGTYEVTLTADPTESNKIINDNFWDAGAVIYYLFSGDFDQTIDMPTQTFDSGGTTYSAYGSGAYDGVTKMFSVNYVVEDADGNVVDQNTHTFEKL